MVVSLPLGELTRGQSAPELNHIATLCGRSGPSVERENQLSDHQCVYALTGRTGAAPVAAISGLADGIDTRNGFWLRADPVRLQVDMGPVYLSAYPSPGHDDKALDIMAAALQEPLAGMGWTLHTPSPERWYLQHEHPVPAWLPEPGASVGVHLAELLPRDEPYRPVRQLQNEIQMLMHQADRSDDPRSPNSLWLWGGGTLPVAQPAPDWGIHVAAAGGRDPFLAGLATLDRVPSMDPASDETITAGQLIWHWQHDPSSDQHSNARRLNRQLGVAIRQLWNGRIERLELDDGNRLHVLHQHDRWRFWRRPQLPES